MQNSKLKPNQVKDLELKAESKMMVNRINRAGKLTTETTIHNSMYDILIRGYVSEMDSFLFGPQIGEGTGVIRMRKQTGSYN